MKIIMSYLPSKSVSPSSTFLSAHFTAPSGSEKPETLSRIADVGRQNSNAIKWPIVIDWFGGQASIGDVEGVKSSLENLRRQRDGEIKEENHTHSGWFT